MTQERHALQMWATTTFIKAAIFNVESDRESQDTLVNDEETIVSYYFIDAIEERLESALKLARVPTAPNHRSSS